MALVRKEVKKLVYPIITFEKKGESFVGVCKTVRKDIETTYGKCDALDLEEMGTKEMYTIFLSASLRLFPFPDMIGKPIQIEYIGQVKNASTKRSYSDYKVYELVEELETGTAGQEG